MRKLIAILIAMAMACVFAPMVGADDSDTIVVTLEPAAEASITVDQSTWTPVCGLGGSNQTATDWATLDNDGTVSVTVDVSATDTAAWDIDAGVAGHNSFKLETIGVAKTLSTTPQVFDNNIAYNENVTFGLKVTMPTSSSTSATQETTITFEATVL